MFFPPIIAFFIPQSKLNTLFFGPFQYEVALLITASASSDVNLFMVVMSHPRFETQILSKGKTRFVYDNGPLGAAGTLVLRHLPLLSEGWGFESQDY